MKKEKEKNDINCLKSAVSCTQFIVVILLYVFMLKGLEKCGHETGLHVRSLKFPWLVLPDVEGVQHGILQTRELILKISSYRDIQKMKTLRFSRQSAREGDKVVSLTHRAPLPPTWNSFLLEPESTPRS